MAGVEQELRRRRPGQSRVTSPRREPDRVEAVSGLFEGETTGAPVCLLIRNEDADPSAYRPTRRVFRPGHADLTVTAKYGTRDWRGGGRSSGRETVARVAAGAMAKQLLSRSGVEVLGFVREVAGCCADPSPLDELVGDGRRFGEARKLIESNPMRCPDQRVAAEMEERVLEAANERDSVGGIVEVRAYGAPAGWGDPVFDKLDAKLAAGALSIGGVKGVEFGAGFEAARLKGSQMNDPLGEAKGSANRAGGILGGISSGRPVVFRLAVKPTPSIGKPQQAIDDEGRPVTLELTGRHDPCLCPRIVVVAEAMAALVLADAMLRDRATCLTPSGREPL
jgi:chorismate synthase